MSEVLDLIKEVEYKVAHLRVICCIQYNNSHLHRYNTWVNCNIFIGVAYLF